MKKCILFLMIATLAWGLYAQDADEAALAEEAVQAAEDAVYVLDGYNEETWIEPARQDDLAEELAEAASYSAEIAENEAEAYGDWAQEAEPGKKQKPGFFGSLLNYFNQPQKKETVHNKAHRYFEFGLGGDVALDNNLVSLTDVLKKEIEIDLNDFHSQLKGKDGGIGLDVGAGAFIHYNARNTGWGFGWDIFNIDGRLDLGLPNSLFDLLANGNLEKHNPSGSFYVSGAVFAESAVEWHGLILNKKLRLSIAPAWYIPLAYIPKSSLTYEVQTEPHMKVNAFGDFDAYTAIGSFEDPLSGMDWGGVDITVSGEYALFPILDVGASITHIPFVPAQLHNRMTYSVGSKGGSIFELPGGIGGLLGDDGLDLTMPELGDPVFSSADAKIILRPLRFDVYVLYRPLRSDLLTIRPNIGFTVLNPSEEAYFNGALEAQLNLGRIFYLSVSTGAEDGFWRNKAKMALNLRAFELDLEAGLKSQDYLKSFSLAGAEVAFALKFGF